MSMIKEKNGYRLRDYVICSWAKNKEVLGVILAFNPDDTVCVEVLLGDKKSDVVQRTQHNFAFSEIKPKEDFSLQYGIGDKGEK